MRELILEKTVYHEGRDIRGFASMLTLEPNSKRNGWVWTAGGGDITITPDIMAGKPRRVALVHKKHTLNEFEHIGILRAAGLHHVRISCSQEWPPYDGCSFGLWNAVMQHVRKGGVLKPHRVPCGFVSHQLAKELGRSVSYTGDGNDTDILHMTGLVNFPRLQKADYRFGFDYPMCDLRPLMRACTLGWPPKLWYASKLASKFGWPHHGNIVWPQEMPPHDVLEETGRHRLLDMLAILNFLAPAGTYLAGALHSCMGSHETDLGVLKKLWTTQLIRLREAA